MKRIAFLVLFGFVVSSVVTSAKAQTIGELQPLKFHRDYTASLLIYAKAFDKYVQNIMECRDSALGAETKAASKEFVNHVEARSRELSKPEPELKLVLQQLSLAMDSLGSAITLMRKCMKKWYGEPA